MIRVRDVEIRGFCSCVTGGCARGVMYVCMCVCVTAAVYVHRADGLVGSFPKRVKARHDDGWLSYGCVI